jgi:hypothetical protein
VTGYCEHGNESSGATKCREFFDELRNYQNFKKASAPWGSLVSLPSHESGR